MKDNKRLGLLGAVAIVIIIGIVGVVATLNRAKKLEDERGFGTRAMIDEISLAVRAYESALGQLPNNLQDLVIGGDMNYPGPFLAGHVVPKDRWGNDFKYEIRDKGFRITSPGKDGAFDTDDDL